MIRARAKAEQEREDAADARAATEQRKLDDEIHRLEAIETAKPLKAAFDKRLMEIIIGPQVGFAAGTELAADLNKLLKQYLTATDHPLNQRLAHWKAAAQGVSPIKVNPLKWREAQAAIDKACLGHDGSHDALMKCAEAIKLWIDSVPWSIAETRVQILVLAATDTRRASR